MVAYREDNDLSSLGQTLINKFHQHLKPLKISYMFKPDATISNGKIICGRAIRVDDRNWAIHNTDFIIEIAKDIWMEATPQFQEAIMDHELCHVGIRTDETGSPAKEEGTGRWKSYVRMHDVEDFTEIVTRHGAYKTDLRDFLKSFEDRKKKEKKDAGVKEDPATVEA